MPRSGRKPGRSIDSGDADLDDLSFDMVGLHDLTADMLDMLQLLDNAADQGEFWHDADHPLYLAMCAADVEDPPELVAPFHWHLPDASAPQPTIGGLLRTLRGTPNSPDPVQNLRGDPRFDALDAAAAASGWDVRVSPAVIDGEPEAITDGRTYGLDIDGRVVALGIGTELGPTGTWAVLDILHERPSVWEVVTLSEVGWRTFTLPTVTAGAGALADPSELLAALDQRDEREAVA